MTTSESLRAMLAEVPMPKLVDRDAFLTWLKFSHGVMRATEPLLEIAALKSEGALREYYQAKQLDEHDHARWLEEDLATLGEKPYVIDHATAATAGAQYYYLQHVGPYALLGYIAALEFRPMPLEHVNALAVAYGEGALRTVRHHAVEDVEHARSLAEVIDLYTEQARIIVYSAMLTARMIGFYLTERTRNA
jgi:hypothetical protein